MKYIIGLGNPGKEYEQNRHNVGFMFLDYFASKLSLGDFSHSNRFKADLIKETKFLLIKPMDFMNNSGQVASGIINFYDKQVNLDAIIVVHDDLDIELGNYKIQKGKGPKVHNGLRDLDSHLIGDAYWHVRIGVDSRNGDRSIPGSNYVLSNFSYTEKTVLHDVFGEIAEELKALIEN